MLFKKFCANIEENNMLCRGDGVVAAVSGGADSMCLLSLLLEYRKQENIRIYCAHVNHGIRETAARDEEFVKEFCEKNNIDFFVKKLNIPQIAKGKNISEELCGREERYAFFFDVLKKTNSTAVFTAHNKDDNAETVLLHLLRGSGTAGMRGIGFSRGDGVFRPLINIKRAEIEEYLISKSIKWVSDETNDTDVYTRNFIRHNILPQMKKVNPAIVDTLFKSSSYFAEDDRCIQQIADGTEAVTQSESGVYIDKNALKSLPVSVAKRVIVSAIKKLNLSLTARDIEGVLRLAFSETGKKYVFPTGDEAVCEYEKIFIHKPERTVCFEYDIEPGEAVFIKEAGVYACLSKEKPEGKSIGVKSGFEYKVRQRRSGDRFVPFGMTGTKKIKDFFIDLKIPAAERDRIPLLVSGDEIACVGDIRADAVFASKNSDNTLYFSIRDN
ncbi:MAG: tRNA lysidine(34) synthetase TilS [Clostridia bacterium]|nr:tRNA lysidine(34) synthetase TilS [Clostridia bacterium]